MRIEGPGGASISKARDRALQGKQFMHITFNLPTILTLIRLVLSPLVLPILLVYLLPYNFVWLNAVLASLFVLFALTDFLDGYLARKLQQETTVGQVLDPIADKFLLYATLVAVLAVHKMYFYWVVIFIGREFFMMGLRHIALENNIVVRVSYLGKIKTMFQMVMLTIIIANPYQQQGMREAFGWNALEMGLILISLVLTLYSAWQYYTTFLKAFREKDMHV